jgi:hypothetical protein
LPRFLRDLVQQSRRINGLAAFAKGLFASL